jgi:hypothetical protein
MDRLAYQIVRRRSDPRSGIKRLVGASRSLADRTKYLSGTGEPPSDLSTT